eukprot:gene11931-biopygen16899
MSARPGNSVAYATNRMRHTRRARGDPNLAVLAVTARDCRPPESLNFRRGHPLHNRGPPTRRRAGTERYNSCGGAGEDSSLCSLGAAWMLPAAPGCSPGAAWVLPGRTFCAARVYMVCTLCAPDVFLGRWLRAAFALQMFRRVAVGPHQRGQRWPRWVPENATSSFPSLRTRRSCQAPPLLCERAQQGRGEGGVLFPALRVYLVKRTRPGRVPS